MTQTNILIQTIKNHCLVPKRLKIQKKLNSDTIFSSAFQSENSLSAMKKEMSFTLSPRDQFKTLPNTESDYNSRIKQVEVYLVLERTLH